MENKKTERLYFRCTKEMKDKIAKLAESEHRTVSNLLEKIILEKIEKE